MKTTTIGAILIALIASACALPAAQNIAHAGAATETTDNLLQTQSIAVIVGQDNLDRESLLQIRRLLENKGLPYEVIPDSELATLTANRFSLVIVLGSTSPKLEPCIAYIKDRVEKGTGLIWIGQGLPQALFDTMGLKRTVLSEFAQNSGQIKYGDASTKLFNETVMITEPAGANSKGYIVDNAGNQIGPAELVFEKAAAGKAYFFAYDVCAWWFADLINPWVRAYQLHLAIEDILSERLTVRLMPFPRNMQSAFITRIEDVDSLHTSPEWVGRAEKFLNYYSAKDAPLTVALTPAYIDPALNLSIRIDAPTAQGLRNWISDVTLRGGTVVAHGYTHQVGDGKTGVSAEFFDDASQSWLPFEEQKQRTQLAADQIHASLGFSVKGFEAPHYIANPVTYRAISESGFEYVTHNSNTAFFDRYNLYGDLVNVPETLGYIPTDAPDDVEANIKSNMDILFNMSGTMLYFNHLFDDKMLQIGENLLDYAQAKGNVWITNTDNLASFWAQRLTAYQQMDIDVTDGNSQVAVNLGPSSRAGLTISLNNAPQIKNVDVNGVQWSAFTDNYIILPALPGNSNTVTIVFKDAGTNINQAYGYSFTILSIIASAFLVLKAKFGKIDLTTHIRRQHK